MIIVMNKEKTSWKSYEEVAAYLLNQIITEFGLEKVEGKQMVMGNRSGIEWEIDAKGVGKGKEIFFIVECRLYKTSRQNQERIGGLAYRIIDTGAKGGILVSPLGLQKGAARIAKMENIHTVILNENCTETEYILKFLDRVRVGMHHHGSITPIGKLSGKIIRKDGTIEDLGELK